MAKKKQKMGFAVMPKDKQRAIAAKGGHAVPNEKRSFSKSPELAAEAGRKGGQNVPDERRSFSTNPTLAVEAGRKGGQRTGKKRASEKVSEAV